MLTNSTALFKNIPAVTSINNISSETVSSDELHNSLKFTDFEKQVIATTLTEIIEQLNLIKNCLIFPLFDWEKAYEDPEQYIIKISGKATEKVFPPYYAYENSPFWKIQVDRHTLHKIIEETLTEINDKGSYSVLNQFLNNTDYIEKQEDIVRSENTLLKKSLNDLKRQLAPKISSSINNNAVEDFFMTDDEILLDEKIKIGTEERYVKAWEDSRIEQNKMKIENKENELVKELKMLASDQKQDTRIHSEIESYILIQIARLEALIMDWTEKYNKELETRDNELIILNAEKENINSKLKNLVIKFHQQRETVEELSKFFEEIEREQEIHIKQVKAASRIQYWWRKYLHLKNEVAAKNRKSKSKKKK